MTPKTVYINGLASVSPQEGMEPDYKQYITPAESRRMAPAVKMGMAAAKMALKDAETGEPDAIITGTGWGCLRDSEKFLENLLDNDEQYLNPTPFIQSTHNTVAGQLALSLSCKAYNITYVHDSISFESALMDAHLQLSVAEATHILAGGVDELTHRTLAFHRAVGFLKENPLDTSDLASSTTPGTVYGQGANFFVLSTENRPGPYARLAAVKTLNNVEKDAIAEQAVAFLREQNLKTEDIDLLLLGNNGDVRYDDYYRLGPGFENTPRAYYKRLCGEFPTASGFGFWLGCDILRRQTVPKAVRLSGFDDRPVNTVLLYNQYRGRNHGFILLERC